MAPPLCYRVLPPFLNISLFRDSNIDLNYVVLYMYDLVPRVLLSFDNEQILIYRGSEWNSRYSAFDSHSKSSK